MSIFFFLSTIIVAHRTSTHLTTHFNTFCSRAYGHSDSPNNNHLPQRTKRLSCPSQVHRGFNELRCGYLFIFFFFSVTNRHTHTRSLRHAERHVVSCFREKKIFTIKFQLYPFPKVYSSYAPDTIAFYSLSFLPVDVCAWLFSDFAVTSLATLCRIKKRTWVLQREN